MTEDELLKNKLVKFIKKNLPLVALNGDYFFVFRVTGLHIVKATGLRLSDIRILQLPAIDLVKGLSDDQWSLLLRKCRTLEYLTPVIFTTSLLSNGKS